MSIYTFIFFFIALLNKVLDFGGLPSPQQIISTISMEETPSTSPLPAHTYLITTALNLLRDHRLSITSTTTTTTTITTTTFTPLPTLPSNPVTPRLYKHRSTLASIVPLPPHTDLNTITELLLSPLLRPQWDIHCPRRPTTLAIPTATSDYQVRDIYPSRLSSPVRALQLYELPIATRRFVTHRQWDYLPQQLTSNQHQHHPLYHWCPKTF